MSEVIIKFSLLSDDAILPVYKHPGDAAMDVYAPCSFILYPHSFSVIGLKLACEFPSDYMLLVQERSSMSNKGIFAIGKVIDSGYRGEIHAGLANISDEQHRFKKWDRIAQLVPVKIGNILIEKWKYNSLSQTNRGSKGFGSTGR